MRQQDRQSRSTVGKGCSGCLGFIFFGLIWFLLPLMFLFVVEAAVVTYALLVSVLWGIGASVDVVRLRLLSRTESSSK